MVKLHCMQPSNQTPPAYLPLYPVKFQQKTHIRCQVQSCIPCLAAPYSSCDILTIPNQGFKSQVSMTYTNNWQHTSQLGTEATITLVASCSAHLIAKQHTCQSDSASPSGAPSIKRWHFQLSKKWVGRDLFPCCVGAAYHLHLVASV